MWISVNRKSKDVGNGKSRIFIKTINGFEKTAVSFVLMPTVVKMSLNWQIWNVPCIVRT